MQMLYSSSEESPDAKGLGVFDRAVRLLPDGVKRPQMQWNRLRFVDAAHPMFTGLDEAGVYFVHSYAAEPGDAVGKDLELRGRGSDKLVSWGGEFGGTVYRRGKITADD